MTSMDSCAGRKAVERRGPTYSCCNHAAARDWGCKGEYRLIVQSTNDTEDSCRLKTMCSTWGLPSRQESCPCCCLWPAMAACVCWRLPAQVAGALGPMANGWHGRLPPAGVAVPAATGQTPGPAPAASDAGRGQDAGSFAWPGPQTRPSACRLPAWRAGRRLPLPALLAAAAAARPC